MNKKYLFPLVLFSLALPGCGKTAKPLVAPVISVNADKTGLVWTEVEGATGYELKVNNAEPMSADSYSFDRNIGNYSVSVRAVCDDETRTSEFSTPFQYSTEEASIGDLTYVDGKISWSSLAGAGAEVKVDDGDFTTIQGTEFTPTTIGLYTIQAKAGWSDADNKFYVTSSKAAKSIYVCPKATQTLVLEDGSAPDNATLQEGYTFLKYNNNAWETAGSSVELNSDENAGATEGNCVQFNYWRHSTYYLFAKQINLTDSHDALELNFKGDGISKCVLAFQVMEDISINGLSLKGIYVKYEVPLLTAKWQHVVLPFSDSGWKINYAGNDMSFVSVQTLLSGYGYRFDSLADLITLTNEFQIRLYAQNDENWSKTKIWADDIQLINTTETSAKLEDIVVVKDKYTVINKDIMFGVTLKDGIATIQGFGSGAYVKDGDSLKLTLTSPVAGEIEFVTSDGGETYDCLSVSGFFQGMVDLKLIPYVNQIDDFESYSATGTGYDGNNKDITKVSGLRAKYYSDYYNEGSSSSIIGGNNWSLMGSSDYLDLATSVAHTGSKSAKFKYNPTNPMRMISGDICMNANASAIGKGSTFSFWVKGGSKYTFKIKVRVYYASAQLNPSTQQSNSTLLDNIEIAQNSDWQQIKVNLDASKTYYGFSITTVANWGGDGADYFYVDDFSIYNAVDPWTIYKAN